MPRWRRPDGRVAESDAWARPPSRRREPVTSARLRCIREEVVHPEDVEGDPAVLEALPVTVLGHLDAGLHLFQRLARLESGGHGGLELFEVLAPRGDVFHSTHRSMTRRDELVAGRLLLRISDHRQPLFELPV